MQNGQLMKNESPWFSLLDHVKVEARGKHANQTMDKE